MTSQPITLAWLPRGRARPLGPPPARLGHPALPPGLNFAFAEPAEPATALGGGSVYDVDIPMGRAALGYWLTPAARGRGVTTHAVRLMARCACKDLGVARLELTCSPGNAASQRVAERGGFTREGVPRSHLTFKGSRRDSVSYSLLPGELG